MSKDFSAYKVPVTVIMHTLCTGEGVSKNLGLSLPIFYTLDSDLSIG